MASARAPLFALLIFSISRSARILLLLPSNLISNLSAIPANADVKCATYLSEWVRYSIPYSKAVRGFFDGVAQGPDALIPQGLIAACR